MGSPLSKKQIIIGSHRTDEEPIAHKPEIPDN